MACSVKWPPKLEKEKEYEQWKSDLKIWCSLTSIEKKKQALAVHLSLSGRARIASSEISPVSLESDDGINVLLTKLDGLFLADEGRRKFVAFESLYLLRRDKQTDVKSFLADFEHAYHKVTKQSMHLHDAVLAYMLLASCALEEKEKQMVMSSIKEVTYDNMKATITKIFVGLSVSGGTKERPVQVKSEPLFIDNDYVSTDGDALYVGLGRSSQRNTAGRQNWRGYSRGVGGRGRQRQPQTFRQQQVGGLGKRKKNPLGLDGKVSKCAICESIYHWARDCPDAYENKGNENFENYKDEPVNLFVGYVNDNDSVDRLQKLVNEASGYAVVDTSCSNTVCGSKWLEDFLRNLSDYERSLVCEESANSSFTFGNGVSVKSYKRVKFPCHIGEMYATITTDVVECNLPLLLSRASMNKAKMIINCATNQVMVNDKKGIINLNTSSSGHYLLPLSL